MKRNLLIIITLFSFMFLMLGTVKAEELKPLDDEALNLIDDTYTFDIKESEIDLSYPLHFECYGTDCTEVTREVKEIYEKYVKVLQEQNYDISHLRGHFEINANDVDIHKFIIEDSKIKKEITISYSNTSQYNIEDKNLVDKEIQNFPNDKEKAQKLGFGLEENYWIIDTFDYKSRLSDEQYSNMKYSYNYKTLLTDKSIDIKVGASDMGDGDDYGDTLGIRYVYQGFTLYYFKNDVYYNAIHVVYLTVPGTKINNTLNVVINKITEEEQKANERYIEMEQEAKKQGLNDILGCYELEALGEIYDGMEISFDVDTKYNNKNVKVLHRKKDNTYEIIDSIVKDGKVTIKVNEFSPFMILLSDKQNDTTITPTEESTINSNSNNPQTSSIDIILYSSTAILSLVGIIYIVIKKRKIA